MINGMTQNQFEEATRRQRQRMFQMGLMMCLVMLMLDAHSTRPISVPKDPNEVDGSNPLEQKPFQQLKKTLATQEGDGRRYPVNASGIYQGAWERRLDFDSARLPAIAEALAASS